MSSAPASSMCCAPILPGIPAIFCQVLQFDPVRTSYLDELFSLDGLTAVVTGGSSGIGAAMAGALGRPGARGVLIARRGARLPPRAARLGEAGRRAAAVPAPPSHPREATTPPPTPP